MLFEFAFFEWPVMLNIFSCFCWLFVLLGSVYSFHSPIFSLRLLFVGSNFFLSPLHVLDMSPVRIGGKFFSHSVHCLLILVSFAVEKLLNLIKAHLLILSIISCALRFCSQSPCLCLCLKGFYLFYLPADYLGVVVL